MKSPCVLMGILERIPACGALPKDEGEGGRHHGKGLLDFHPPPGL